MNLNAVEIVALLLFMIALLGLLIKRNIIKSILCLAIIDLSVVLFFLGINAEKNQVPPIGTVKNAADPVAQAIMITAIVIGIAVTSVSLMMFIALYHRYGTADWKKALDARSRET
jgi:multicomponent Na+:H+ antiporter subunit C